ncbi:hypothetical protein JOD82_001741 [Paenibacillus sp. 1182]|uniref:stalk domain-containing protein n=1 Tax=Paenibacillus sp. 1182 TaxID=2806565 RepID=UPI001AE67CAA|nr:stalk domain-containing protein [Paenibacillus sp. 1182]MBP1308721.1 hypothetical protein [Paenibacillus sp. 1182]
MKTENIKKVMFDWRTLTIAFIVAILVVLSTFAGNTTSLYVKGKDITKNGEPTYRGGVLYLPVETIVKGMGDTFIWAKKPYIANVTTNDGRKIGITVSQSTVNVDGKTVPVSIMEIKGTKVPQQAKPVTINNRLYVPYDFFKNVLKYPIETKKNGTKEIIYVGNTNVATPSTPTAEQTPTSSVKEDPRYPFPKGWTPPQLQSKWSADKQKNMEILANELEFKNLGAGASYSPYGFGASAILMSAQNYEEYDTRIQFDVWKGSKYTVEDYKIPYIARELFKLYFPTKYNDIWTIVDNAYNDKNVDKYLNKMLQYDNRQIKFMIVKESLVIIVGKPGVSYDSNWKVK